MKRTREIEILKDSTILSLAAVAETRDPETGDHLLRTQRYLIALAIAMQENTNYKDVITNSYVDLLLSLLRYMTLVKLVCQIAFY